MESDQRLILHNISRETYECLLADYAESHGAHFAYDRGWLEIAKPAGRHEKLNRALALFIEIIAEEMQIEIQSLGSTTLKRDDLCRGFEPDSCFYIQHEEQVRDKEDIDLENDPPPDLVIEIDIASPSLDKLPIYTALGIPEIWRYDGNGLTILRLERNGYREHDGSAAFPGLTGQVIRQFIEDGCSMRRRDWFQEIREWVRRSDLAR